MARSKVVRRHVTHSPSVAPLGGAEVTDQQQSLPEQADAETLRAMFAQWEAEDALLDPIEAEADWEDFKASMNAARPPEYPIYPA